MTNNEEELGALERFSSPLAGVARMVVIDEHRDDYVEKSILVASAAKVCQQIRAMRVLSEANCPEEVAGVARVLVEVVINAIYLQHSDESEVNSFLHFDSQKINSRLLQDYIASGQQTQADSAAASLQIQRRPNRARRSSIELE